MDRPPIFFQPNLLTTELQQPQQQQQPPQQQPQQLIGDRQTQQGSRNFTARALFSDDSNTDLNIYNIPFSTANFTQAGVRPHFTYSFRPNIEDAGARGGPYLNNFFENIR